MNNLNVIIDLINNLQSIMTRALNLRSFDLNLLVLFDALMSEGNVTRAASKVAVTQSAMSNALSRLRYLFKDELFVRTAKGMEPTPRALELGPSVRSILQQTTRLLTSDLQFDPMTSVDRFSCRMSDLIGSLILPPLMSRLVSESPGLSLEVTHISPDATVNALESDQLDMAISMHLNHKSTVQSQPLFSDRMVCLVRNGHALSSGKMTMKKFLSYGHLRVAMSPTDIRFVDSVLADEGLSRNVTLTVPHWLLVPQILSSTDLISVMSERTAKNLIQSGVVVRPLPFNAEVFFWTLYWHRRYDHSRSHAWVRNKIIETAECL